MIDAAIGGGIMRYNTFLSVEFIGSTPENAKLAEKLKSNLLHQVFSYYVFSLCEYQLSLQVKVMARATEVHRKLCTDNLLRLQQKMDRKYKLSIKNED